MKSPQRWSLIAAMLLAGARHAQSSANRPDAPKTLQPPADQVLFLHVQGKGNQIYACETSADGAPAWKFKAPEAKLYGANGGLAGRHFAGPTWQANDESKVVGKVAASVPSPDANSVPWLLLTMVSHSEKGIFSRVLNIQRLATKGGVAPATGCDASNLKKEIQVPYEATYYFYGEPQLGVPNLPPQ
jgi:hypothetical protein